MQQLAAMVMARVLMVLPGCCFLSAVAGCHAGTLPGRTEMAVRPTDPAVPATIAAASERTASRPPYNRGDGFFVLHGRLYDANGHEFRIRGVNRLHWDSNAAAGIARSGANTVRWNIDFSRPAADNVRLIREQSIRYREVPIVGNWAGTCKSDTSLLQSMVATWVQQAPQWTRLNRYLILNVANEWGPPDSTVWRDAYIAAIARLRAAGYTGPILVDSGGCGQDMDDLLKYSQAVFDSDAERNVMFALHIYGGTNDDTAGIRSVSTGRQTVITLAANGPCHPFSSQGSCYTGSGNNWTGTTSYYLSGVQGMPELDGVQPASANNIGGSPGAWTITLAVDSSRWGSYTGGGTIVDNGANYALRIARLAALARRTGAVYIIGEFGPGHGIGPSPTRVTAAQVITAAEAHGIGWLAWAWDDNNLANCQANDDWFSMTRDCGVYRRRSDLTRFGREVVLNPQYGLQALARPASVFERSRRRP